MSLCCHSSYKHQSESYQVKTLRFAPTAIIFITQFSKEVANKSVGAKSFPSPPWSLSEPVWIIVPKRECFASVCKFPR